MSNPGSPAKIVGDEGVQIKNEEKNEKDNGQTTENISIKENWAAPHLHPVVRLNPLQISEAQLKAITRKSNFGDSSGDCCKQVMEGSSSSAAETMNTGNETVTTTKVVDTAEASGLGVGAVVILKKPRRSSVHFAEPAVTDIVEVEQKMRAIPSILDRGKQESSRKHRSRKEKLICRSENLSDMGVDPDDIQDMSPQTPPFAVPSSSAGNMSVVNPAGLRLSESISHDEKISGPVPIKTKSFLPQISARGSTNTVARPQKRPIKRSISSNIRASNGSSRKSSPVFASSSSVISKEPVKKKKVIEIVSPRKRKLDHIDLMKTTSDPIFVRAANKTFRHKNKSHRNRLKFSRHSLKANNQSGSRFRRESSSSSIGVMHKYKMGMFGALPPVKEPESEPPYPAAFVDDFLWLLQEAEKEFTHDSLNRTTSIPTSASVSSAEMSDPIPSTSVASAKRLAFGRRRVESEPTSGFEIAPNSPSGPQSFYHLRKEIYFSPSPSYSAPGPTGRRRYSRRRHAKIHPPFDNTNCNFQNHFCPNFKVPGSQYCEKHLDQGPTSAYNHCRFMKEGRQCGNVFPNRDPAVTFCEEHAYFVAKSEFDIRNPNLQPDPAKNIVSKMNKILSEGFMKSDGEKVDTSSPVILQISEEPDIIQDLPLGNFTGGQLEECDSEGERNVNPDKPDYDSLKNAGYFTTEEIIQIHINKLRKLKALYQREKELDWLTRQHKFRYFKESLEKLKHFGPRFTTNPYRIDKCGTDLPKEYIDHQIKQYEAAKAILQGAYRVDGQKGLLRLKMLKKTQELERMAKASVQKQQDTADIYDSESEVDSDCGDPRERRESSRYTAGVKAVKCAYNEGYAIRACQNPPVNLSKFCYKHLLSDPKQVPWVSCNRRIGQDPQDVCKTPVFRILQKHGCSAHTPLLLLKHKPLRRSEEDLTQLGDSDKDEDEVSLEEETGALENLVSDECINVNHLENWQAQLAVRGPLDITDTSDSEETDEEGGIIGALVTSAEENDNLKQSISL